MLKKLSITFFVISSTLLIAHNGYAKDNSVYGPKEFSDKNKWTAIVAAYAPEIKAIDQAFEQLADAQIDQTLIIKGVKYQLGTYKEEPVVIFTTGISVPNAAMTMQMALDYFPIDRVVMMGIAGAINPDFQPGDISVPERWYFHDESVYVNPDPTAVGSFILPDYYENALQKYKEKGTGSTFSSLREFWLYSPRRNVSSQTGLEQA